MELNCGIKVFSALLDIIFTMARKMTKKKGKDQKVLERMSSFCNFIKENLLQATIELAAETKKSALNLSNSGLTEIPVSVLKFMDLTKLYMNNNSIKHVPNEISNLKYLRVLALDYNILYKIPPAVGKLADLVCLNLSYNNLTYLFPEIGQLTKLEVLWLNHTHLESLPPEIGNCTYLDTLGARGNFLKELPPEIGALHRLRWLTLEGNLLSNLPAEIVGLVNLIHLNLSNNQFETLPKLDDLRALKFIFFSQNFLTQLDMDALERLSFVREIDLTDNPISNTSIYTKFKNVKLADQAVVRHDGVFSDTSESDSEDWEESAPSSDLNITDSSVEDLQLDEILEDALPQVARFTSTGI